MTVLASRYVVPVDGPVVEDGAIRIEQGRIVALGRREGLRGGSIADYGDSVIVPGLVNAHTHLELSLLAGQVLPDGDFVPWLRRLVTRLRTSPLSQSDLVRAVETGIAESLSSGVTTLGDITRMPAWTRPMLSRSPLRAVSFGEVIAIGTQRHLLSDRLDAAVSAHRRVEPAQDRALPANRRVEPALQHTDTLRVGISPHSPYTLEPNGLRLCAARARELGLPLCIHLAESLDEDQFVRRGDGRLADYLHDVGVWDEHIPTPGCGPVELAERTGLVTPRTLIAHANYVSDEDVATLASSGASVAYCPRTHHAFRHPPHPFRKMLAAGVNVCLGTDSLASSPSLSILDELRFLRSMQPDLDALDLLAMGTKNGAQAFGFGDVVGSISPGKLADLVVVPLESSDHSVQWDAIFDSPSPPVAVYVAGRSMG